MPRHIIRPQDRGRKPCLSPEGPLVPYQVKIPPSLKAWALKKGSRYIRALLENSKAGEDLLE